MKLSKTQWAGLILGAIGFLIPLLLTFPGLSYAGHIALSIFLLAAVFWMFEPIPIYSTSILIILLEVLLLSMQGPMFMDAELPTGTLKQGGSSRFSVPEESVSTQQVLYTVDARGELTAHRVSVQSSSERGELLVASPDLRAGMQVVTDAGHKLIGYQPNSYADYLATMASPIIILFLGGFILAEASVKYNLDRNLTRLLLRPFGEKPKYIVLGLMLVTAVLSAFMSNTATTAMMMTVILPIVSRFDTDDAIRIGIALSIPFAANIGGIATPIGTPPNAVVIGALSQQGMDIAFGQWMGYAAPVALVMLVVAWAGLLVMYPPKAEKLGLDLGGKFDTSTNALILYVVFGFTVLAWVTESLHGINSNMVALIPLAALTFFGVIDKEEIRNLPWEVLWLVAGGLALGIAMDRTGLAQWLISSIEWGSLGRIWLLLVFGLVAVGMSNFLSNTVTATLLIPLAISLAASGMAGSGFNLLVTSLVIGIGASMAMVLPISTPPNAIAISTGMVKTKDMAKAGVLVGIIGLVMVMACSILYWPFL